MSFPTMYHPLSERSKEVLEKQLELLSEYSKSALNGNELSELTDAMVRLIETLYEFRG